MDRKPYTHVRLIIHEGKDIDRYEIRVSTFVEFDENAGRRAITGKPTKKQAEVIAKEIARREKAKTGGSD